MFRRIGRLQIVPPQPKDAPPDWVAAVQELLGGRFGSSFNGTSAAAFGRE